MGRQQEQNGTQLDFEQILEKVGTNGRYQVMMTIITALAHIPNAMAAIAAVFTAASPDFWCAVPELADLTVDQQKRLSAPPGEEGGFDVCRVYDVRNYSLLMNGVNASDPADLGSHVPNTTIVNCHNFRYDTSSYDSTIVTEWDLVCSRTWMKTLSTSLFMLGQLIGVLVFGHLADLIGRRLAWFISVWVTLLSGSAAAFVPNFWAYVILRMLSAASSLGGCVCTYTLGMEVVGANNRAAVYLLPHLSYGVGVMLLAFVAFFIRDYSWLQLTVSLTALPMVATYWILGESPRWLLRNGRVEEAGKEIHRMARINKRAVPQDLLSRLESPLLESRITLEEKRSMVDLLRTPNIRCKTLITWFAWFATSLVYFGLSLGTGNLAGSTHANLCIGGFVDIMSAVGLFFFLDRVGRRTLLVVSFIFVGIFCGLTVVVPSGLSWLATAFSMVGRLGIVVSFIVIYLHAVEFYPTVVRGIGLGAASMSARVGSILAPFIADLGLLTWPPLTQVVFAVIGLVAGLLCLFQPETRHQKLPETLEEGERFARHPLLHHMKCCGHASIDSDEDDEEEDRVGDEDKNNAAIMLKPTADTPVDARAVEA